MKDQINIAKTLAPEDIRPGTYVSILHVFEEFTPFIFGFEPPREPPETFRVMRMPRKVRPLRIVDVCLPFVLVEDTDGTPRTLDVRRYRLAALTDRYGRKAFDRLKTRKKKGKT
jgi:hypothetical protein